MTEKDLKEAAGKKLEEAYKLKSLEGGPSEETVAKWIAIADQRRAENRRRKKKILSCAAALVMCVCVGVTCVMASPNAVAGGSGGAKVEAGMSTKDVYKSEDDLPEDIKNEFLMFPYIPEEYEFVEAVIIEAENVKRISLIYKNVAGEEIVIKENNANGDGTVSQTINPEITTELWEGIKVNISTYDDGEKGHVYSFERDSLLIMVKANENLPKEKIQEMIKTAVWQ